MIPSVLLLVGFLAFSPQDATEPTLFPGGYSDFDGLSAALKKVATEHPELVKVKSLGKTAGGRDLWMATVGRSAERRPSILVVGNLEADHVVGSQVALRFVEGLVESAKDPKSPLDTVTIHIVPRLNPDGAERVLKGAPRSSFRANLTAIDRDRDGQSNEDGPDDLDGDDLTTRMRIKDPRGTLIPDEKEPRIFRKAAPEKGERGLWIEAVEGLDNDGDGLINEDPPGGVNLNRNWPHNWTEFDLESGFTPGAEPETRPLIEFVTGHPEIFAVWTLSLNDSLRNEPKKPGSTIDDADLPVFVELSKRFNSMAKLPPVAESPVTPAAGFVSKETPEERTARLAKLKPKRKTNPGKPVVSATPPPIPLEGTTDGAMSEWAYHQLGVVGLASRLWHIPEVPEPPKGQPAPPADGDSRWFYWNDKVMNGRAFVPFHAFDHPELGAIEIGGWKPGVRTNPPIERVAPIASSHLAFLLDLAGKAAKLQLQGAKVESRGAGVFEVSLAVVNDGFLPSALAQGVKVNKSHPVLVHIKGQGVKLLSGKPTERIEALAGSGGRVEYRWLVYAPEANRTVKVEASSPKAGRAEIVLDLK